MGMAMAMEYVCMYGDSRVHKVICTFCDVSHSITMGMAMEACMYVCGGHGCSSRLD